MALQAKIVKWLKERLLAELDASMDSAWVIGSVAAGASHPNDCDVLLLVDSGRVPLLAQLSPVWRSEFELEFGIPLHLTRLTAEETKHCAEFLNSVFGKNHISIEPAEPEHDNCTSQAT